MIDSNITKTGEIPPVNTLLTIGAQLRAARKENGRNIADIANELRISVAYINAIEKGDLDVLPPSTYVAGFLRSYGNLVGIDGNDLARSYLDRISSADRQPTYSFPQSKMKSQRPGALVASITVVLVVAGYAGWYWNETKSNKPHDDATIIVTAPTVPEAGPGVSGIGTPALTKPDGMAQTVLAEGREDKLLAIGADATKPMADDKLVVESVAEVSVPGLPKPGLPRVNGASDENVTFDPVMTVSVTTETTNETETLTETLIVPLATLKTDVVSNDVADISADDSTILPEADSNIVSQNVAVAKQRDPSQEIIIRATSSSWVEIIRNNGEEVMTQLMRDGDSYVVDSTENLYLSTGNAGGIEFVIGSDDAISAGKVGEIVRDMPLDVDKLRTRL